MASLSGTWPGIQKTPGVMGGDACIRQTRIPVWLPVSSRHQGAKIVIVKTGILILLELSPELLAQGESAIRVELALQLYLHKLFTLEQAHRLAEISLETFQQRLAEKGVETTVVSPDIPAHNNQVSPDEDIDDEPKELILDSLWQAWHEVKTGQMLPLSQLWEGIDVEQNLLPQVLQSLTISSP